MPYPQELPRGAYSVLGGAIQGSPIDASLSLAGTYDRPVISLAMGSPAPDAIPAATLAELANELLSGPRATSSLDYLPTEGEPELRRALLARLAASGADVAPRNLLITAGGMQGLDLVARLFVGHGDIVAVEAPSYANGLATLRNHGAELLPVQVDADGMDVEALEASINAAPRRPALIYTIPTFQNPSGTTLSLARREALLALADRYGVMILEDDPYGELRYSGEDLPTLLDLDRGAGRVIQVRTFSKIITPGLRVGWVVGPADVIDRMVKAKQSMDTCANSIAQGIVRLMLVQGLVDPHIARLRRLYPARRDAMSDALAAAIPASAGASWTRPAGGMFLWLTLPAHVSGNALAKACLENGVVVVPGSAFAVAGDSPALRLCFSSVREEDIGPAVSRLAAGLDQLLAESA